ncbi:MAG: cupin domain-containing protein [Pseudomonadota bacterium]
MPKVDRAIAQRYERQAYPGKLAHRTDGCWKTKLSDAIGLTQMGIGEVELAPGSATGLLHYHHGADEMIYVLDGEVTLVEEGGDEEVLRAGDAAAWKAGDVVGHTIENRSDKPARLLEIGTRPAEDTAIYVGLDLMYRARYGADIAIRSRGGRLYKAGEEVPEIDELPIDMRG